MAFPSPYMQSQGHAMGMPGLGMGGFAMLPPPPGSGMIPPSPMSMPGSPMIGHGGFGGHGAEQQAMVPFSAGHPSPISPMQLQQMQAARMHGGQPRPFSAGTFGQPHPGYGYSGANGQLAMPMTPPPSGHIGGSYGQHDMGMMQQQQAQAQAQAQAMHGLHGPHSSLMRERAQTHSPAHFQPHEIDDDPFAQSPVAAGPSGHGQQVYMPQMGDPTAAYVRGAPAALPNMKGRLRGQTTGSGMQQMNTSGDFEMEQEVTVKTKLRGRGGMSGNSHDNSNATMDLSHRLGPKGQHGVGPSAFGAPRPPLGHAALPYQGDMFGQHQNSAGFGMHHPGAFASHMPTGRPPTPF